MFKVFFISQDQEMSVKWITVYYEDDVLDLEKVKKAKETAEQSSKKELDVYLVQKLDV